MVHFFNDTLYITKDGVVSLGLTTERYLWNGKKKPPHWEISLHPANKKIMLLRYEALLDEHKQKIVDALGSNPYELIVRQPVLDKIKINPAAYDFYNRYTYNGGIKLPYKKILQYSRGEAILNFINTHTNIKDIRKIFGMDAPAFYTHITAIAKEEQLNGSKKDYEGQRQVDGKFPTCYAKLLKKARMYAAEGFGLLIHPNYGNDYSAKVNEATEQLLNEIYILNEKPNYTKVHSIYDDFVNGKISLVSEDTGEIYDHTKFKPISISCVYSYVAAWENKSVTHRKRSNDKIAYNAAYRPYASLENPVYAGSLISMDDRDLPFKTTTGVRVKAYLAMDVASEVFIGYAFDATDKDMALVMKCFTDMYQKLDANNFCQPAEVEVEQHLMSTLSEGLLKEGAVFPFVRFAQAANPQEKSIERAFRRMRYGIDKTIKGWIPRPFAKDEANQGRLEDEIKTAYTPQQVIEIAISNINWWHNQPHPNQKLYKGLTRMQVWLQKQNANLLPINRQQVARYIGKHTTSSINRGEIRAFNSLYVLDKMALTAELDNGKDLDIYAIENTDGSIPNIYVYKNDAYVLTANKKVKWQKARVEQTDDDKEKIAIQQKYTAEFDATVKNKKNNLKKLVVVNNAAINQALTKDVKVIEDVPEKEYQLTVQNIDYAKQAIANL